MNKILKRIVLCIISICINNAAMAATPNKNMKKVLISQVTDHAALNMTTKGIIDSLQEAGYVRGVNLELRIESAQASTAMAAQIANKFVSQNPDVVVGVGTISAQSFVKYAALNRTKLVFSSVTDPVAANLAVSNVKAISNISGVSNFVPLEPQLQLFKDLQPNLKRLGIIYNPGEINSVKLVDKLERACKQFKIVLVKQTIIKTADAAQAAVKLADSVDAIFISNDNTALSSLRTIVKAAQQQDIPVYVSDTDAVELGAVAALGPNQYEIGLQTGKMVANILSGADIRDIPIEFPANNELYINIDAATLAKLYVSKTKLSQASQVVHKNQS